MRRLFVFLGVCASFILFFSGCSTTYIDQPSSQIQMVAQAKIDPILSIGPQIEGIASVERIFFIFVSGPGKFAEGVTYGNIQGDTGVSDSMFSDTLKLARAAAAYRACAENKADLIVYPRYVVRVDDYFFYKSVTAKVMGYKGVLKDIKVIDYDEQRREQADMVGYLKEIKDNLGSIKSTEPRETEQINKTLQKIRSYLKAIDNRNAMDDAKKAEEAKKQAENMPTNSANVVPLKF